MEDYNKVLDATEVAENANGVAAEKMTVYNESLAAAQNRLTASIQQFAQDSNLDQILAKAYDGLSKVVDILNILLNKIPILSPLIKAMGVALATAFAGATINNILSTSKILGAIVSAAPAVISAFSQMASGAAGFGAVVTAAGGPVTVILSALAAIIALAPAVKFAWDEIFPSAEQKAKDAQNALQESQTELDTTNSKIKEIQSQIDEINSRGALTLTDKAEKQELQDQLDILTQIKETQEIINRERQSQALSAERAKAGEMVSYSRDEVSQYQAGLASTGNYLAVVSTDNINELIAAYRQLNQEKKALDSTAKDYAQQVATNEQLTSSLTTKLLEQKQAYLAEMQSLSKLGDTSSDYYNNLKQAVNEIDITLDSSNFVTLEISELIDTTGVKGKLQKASNEARNSLEKAASDTSVAVQKKAVDASKNLSDTITSSANEIAQKIMEDEDLKSMFAQAFNININELEDNTDEVVAVIRQRLSEAYGVAITSANNAESAIGSANGEIKTAAELADELGQRQVDLAEKTKSLSDAYNAMVDKGKITKSQMNALIKQYPELTSKIEIQNGVIKISTEELQDKYDVVIKEEEAFYQAQINETNILIEKTKARIKAYESEILSLQALGIARGETLDIEGEQYYKWGSAGSLADNLKLSSVYSKTQYNEDKKNLDDLLAKLQTLQVNLDSLSGDTLTYTGSKTGSSAADKAAKEFENRVKNIPKQLKTLVTLYSKEDAWNSPEVIANYKEQYQKMLDSVVNDSKAREILAEAYNLDITDMPVEDQIKNLTTLIEEQASTIDEARQKLQENYLKGLKEVEEAEKKQYEEAKKQIEALNKMTQDMIETAIDLLDKAGSFVFSLLDKVSDRYDKQIDNLDKIMDDLDDQKDAFDDKIDAQKEYLKLQKEEIDNQKELAEKTQSIADIDARLIEMQYDDSAAAQTERLKLLDERAKKEKELKEFQDETAYDAKMNALDAQKKQFDTAIETQKKALEQQKQALEESQKKFESAVNSIKSAFDGFIKILNSTVFKNLATNLLNSIDGETLNKALSLWNRLFGTGLQSDVTSTWDAAYEMATKYGWQPGKNLRGVTNALGQGVSTKEDNIAQIGQAQTANKAGDLNLADSLVSGLKTDSIQKQLDQVTNIFNNTKTTIGNIMDSLGKGIETVFGDVGKNIVSFAKGIGGSIQSGIKVASDLFGGLGQTLKNVFNIDWGGITGSVSDGLGVVSQVFGSMFTPIAKGAASIGDAIGAGVTGFFPGIFSALGTLVTTVGTAMTGILTSIAEALASIPIAGWALAAVAFAGIAGLIASIANVSSQTKSAKVSQPTQSFYAKKHHSGADYVKKENPELDKMFGLNDDETVSILKVGEAVVPTWANTATSSDSGNIYTGEVATRAVNTTKQATRTSYSASDGNSVINTISMPITIQGNADDSTVKALKEQSEKIAKTVFKLINKQTNMSGYRNVKAATI